MEEEKLTREKLLGASVSDELHDNEHCNADGSCRRWRVNGKAKTWVGRPEEFRVPIKYGLRVCGAITEANVTDFHLGSECPYVQFRYLSDGDKFVFRKHWFSGPPFGPWVKVSQRGYVHEDDFNAGWRGARHKVGSINAWTELVEDE